MQKELLDNRETLIKLVKKEAKKLREAATPDELSMLEYHNLSVYSNTRCIYGQMTGDCYSDRAGELIRKCCERVYIGLNSAILNGKPHPTDDRAHEYHSPIEIYITDCKDEYKDNLINYLKGKVDKLIIK